MPEGDTIFRAAQALHRALAGGTVVGFETVLPALSRVDDDHPIEGRTIESVTSIGKHLLIAFSGDLILHTHMRMNGSWHLYRPGARWRRPRRDMRVLVATRDGVAVGFNVPVAEFLTSQRLRRHPELTTLGPDLLGSAFDEDEAMRRIRAHGSQPIAEVLLDQRALAGIGNVLKSETLFVSRISPFAQVAQLSDEDLRRAMAKARALMHLSVKQGGRRDLWVYGRSGRPCRRCGTMIRAIKTGSDARLTYWCPRCQAVGNQQAPNVGR